MIETRNRAMLSMLIALVTVIVVPTTGVGMSPFKVATFSVDVTPPLGHPLLASINSPPVREIADPLYAKGFVLLGTDKPIVVVSVDWLEIRNDAYDRWRDVIADAVGTTPPRVLVHSVHQHDAPIVDLAAQRLLDKQGIAEGIIDLKFHEQSVQRVADAAKKSLETARQITHYGIGRAIVDRVSANRRYIDSDGVPQHSRFSSMRDCYAKKQPEGLTDPWLKTLSFWNGETPLMALTSYSTHPQSIYRTGRVSADFPGLARARRQAEVPDVPQIYVSGASGNVIAGKYNDGSEQDRRGLVDRLHRAIVKAWESTVRRPLSQVEFRADPVALKIRNSPGFTGEDLQHRLLHAKSSTDSSLAAMGLSCRHKFESGNPILVAAIDLGEAQFVLLPGESYVEYQLFAQKVRPDSFVVVAGYGECSTGYIPPEKAWEERDLNLADWCWISPGAERSMHDAIRRVLTSKDP